MICPIGCCERWGDRRTGSVDCALSNAQKSGANRFLNDQMTNRSARIRYLKEDERRTDGSDGRSQWPFLPIW